MKLSNEMQAEIELRTQKLNELKLILKKDFFGIDIIIEQLIDSIEPWYIFSEFNSRPYIINLWGMTGCGKTAVIRKIIDYLDLKDNFLYLNMTEYALSNNSTLNSFFGDDLSYLNGKPCIICIDELQNLRTINAKREEYDNSETGRIWELFDTGILEVNDYNKAGYADSIKLLISVLKKTMNRNIIVENGIVTQGTTEYQKIMKDSSSKYNLSIDNYFNYSNKREIIKDDEEVLFIPRTYYDDFYELMKKDFENIFEFEKYILSLNPDDAIKFLELIIRKKYEPKMLDLSKSLIINIGNLDEVYQMSSDLNPDNDPDKFYERTKDISMTTIKKELGARFRQEQIARFGNNHIIYPALNKKAFVDLINNNLNKFVDKVKEHYDLKLDFHKSVHDIIYRESVNPAQGARPILTSINMLIDTFFSKIMSDIIKLKVDVEKLDWSFVESKFVIKLISSDGIQIKIFDYQVNLKIDNLRCSRGDDMQALIAIHEAGHAIAQTVLTKVLPHCIFSVTADDDMGGRTTNNKRFEILTKEYLESNIAIGLAGRTAEIIIFGEQNLTAGCISDLNNATDIARKMIKQYGMGRYPYSICNSYSFEEHLVFHEDEHNEAVKATIIDAEKKVTDILIRNKRLLLELGDYLGKNSNMNSEKFLEYFKKYSVEEWANTDFAIQPDEYYNYKKMLNEQLEMFKNVDRKN
jgi:cell division protease FtsH